jgi:protein-tyrosine-phosphatase
MTAEHAFRAQINPGEELVVSSAGTKANPMEMYEAVRLRLIDLGIDPSAHKQRKLTQGLLDGADLSIAMSLDHQVFVREQFDREIPLFNRVCYGRDEALLDLGESLTNWQDDRAAADTYVRQMVDTIWDGMPSFKANMDQFWR